MDAEFEGVPVSATDGYTLSTEQVRNMIGRAPVEGLRDWRIEFDRWLAAERTKARQEAFEEAAVIAYDLALKLNMEADSDRGLRLVNQSTGAAKAGSAIQEAALREVQ